MRRGGGGGGSKAVWIFSENSSVLEAHPSLRCIAIAQLSCEQCYCSR